MIRFSNIFLVGSLAYGFASIAVLAQDATPAAKAAYTRVIGEVTAVDPENHKLSVKIDNDGAADIPLDSNTAFMSVAPGEKDLKKATRIDLADVKVGDRVIARSPKTDSAAPAIAQSVIVMSKVAIVKHQEASKEEWSKRGSAGKVKAVDPAAKTITISVQTATGLKELTLNIDDKTNFRRYAAESVRFSDATPAKFADIQAGNSLRVLGDKNTEGTTQHAEEIIFGSFRNIAGAVVSVDTATREIKLTDLSNKKPVLIKVTDDTNMRKLPQMMAYGMARMRQTTPANGAAAPGGTPVAGAAPSGMGMRPGGAPGASGGPGGMGGPAGGGFAKMDFNQMMERIPTFALADLKPGDALIITSTNGPDPARVTAVSIVAGVDPIFAAAPPTAQQPLGGAWSFDGGAPQQ